MGEIEVCGGCGGETDYLPNIHSFIDRTSLARCWFHSQAAVAVRALPCSVLPHSSSGEDRAIPTYPPFAWCRLDFPLNFIVSPPLVASPEPEFLRFPDVSGCRCEGVVRTRRSVKFLFCKSKISRHGFKSVISICLFSQSQISSYIENRKLAVMFESSESSIMFWGSKFLTSSALRFQISD